MKKKDENLPMKGFIEPDILLVDKPYGMTSFGLIRQLRKKLGIKKLGHAGTLDPLATGLMIIGVGSGTKKLAEYIKLPKSYRAEILVGIATDTADQEGKEVERKEIEKISEQEVSDIVQTLEGEIQLAVPVYSAVKVGGKKLYEYMRTGKEIPEIPVRTMLIDRAAVLDAYVRDDRTAIVVVRFDVASGTYIRALAEEVGRRLGYPSSLWNLRRTKIADWNIDQAAKLDEI